MPALNRVQLIGYLGQDPEVRYTPRGTRYTRFSVAVTRTWTTAEGEKREATDWFRVEAWGRLGEICAEYLRKGRLVYIEGRLRTDRWEDAQGKTRSRTVVVATGMQMLDRKPSEEVPEVVEEAAVPGEVEEIEETGEAEPEEVVEA